MKFGLILTIWRLTLKEATALTTKAEELGFDGVLIPDHVCITPMVTANYGPHWPDPFSVLAHLAAHTSKVDLGTSIIVLPYRSPLQQAQAAATVDQLTEGRFIFGLGAGWAEDEFNALKVPFAERGKITDEYIQIIKTTWEGPHASFSGDYYQFEDVTIAPGPVQKPHPPIWVGGVPMVASRPSIRRAVKYGDAWHPVFLPWTELEKGARMLQEEMEKHGREGVPMIPRNLLHLTDEPLGDDRPPFHGSSEQIIEDLRRARQMGVPYITFDPAPMSVDETMAMLTRFAEEVIPAFR